MSKQTDDDRVGPHGWGLKFQDTTVSPATTLEKFAQNFRNMGVCVRYEARGGEQVHYKGASHHHGDTLAAYFTRRGVGLTTVRNNGFDFEVVDITCIEDGAPSDEETETLIRVVFHLNEIEVGY